jgi:hypothetical protein
MPRRFPDRQYGPIRHFPDRIDPEEIEMSRDLFIERTATADAFDTPLFPNTTPKTGENLRLRIQRIASDNINI